MSTGNRFSLNIIQFDICITNIEYLNILAFIVSKQKILLVASTFEIYEILSTVKRLIETYEL